ncbi:MAG: hypothetical protein OIF57_04045 [Marinobacterium sp.]|nr:hypothetical protein [Marinobacterium sp.]
MNINSAGNVLSVHDLTPISKRPVKTDSTQNHEPFTKVADVPLATFDQYSKGHLETLNKSLQATFRVDGVLVAAVFDGETVVTKPAALTLKSEGSNRLQEVREQLEQRYGSRLEVEMFSASDGLTLRHFGNGDLFTDADKTSGWAPNPTLSDREFKQAWEKISVYQNLEASGTLGFKTNT